MTRDWLWSLLFVVVLGAASVAFSLFVDLCDTGTVLPLPDNLPLFLVCGGVLTGLAALAVERGIYRQRGMWPRRCWMFLFRLVVFSALWIALGYAIGVFAHTALFNDDPWVGLSWWLLPPFAVFYTPMALPLAIPAGILCGALLRRYSRGPTSM